MTQKHLKITEYLRVLQIEYIQNEIRKKIYSKKNKDYYKKVLQFKEEKIKDIGHKNTLPTIFDDEILRNEFIELVYSRIGYPTFLTEEELSYYFARQCEVKIVENDVVSIGHIIDYDATERVVEIFTDGKTLKVDRSRVTRLL